MVTCGRVVLASLVPYKGLEILSTWVYSYVKLSYTFVIYKFLMCELYISKNSNSFNE